MPDLGLRVDPETGVGLVEIEGTAVVLEEKEQPLVLGNGDGPAVLVQEKNPIVVGKDGTAVEVKPSG
jgi:hypothetical protein